MDEKFPAVFLDRDGVICKEKSYVTSPQQLEIYPFAASAVKMLRDAGWKVIVVTNQSAVAHGMLKESELQLIHQKLTEILPVDRIYYCPHYPPEDEDVLPYRIRCSCRKPEPGMLLKAASEEQIDLNRSYMVGDRAIDILAGKKAGAATVLVRTGYGEKGLEQDVRPDFIFSDLKEFVEYIVRICPKSN